MRRIALSLLLTAVTLRAQGALDEFFQGEVRNIRGNRVTLHYDFRHRMQLKDFELLSIEGLVAPRAGEARIEEGQLRLEKTVALLHRATGVGRLHARMKVKPVSTRDLGTFFAPPTGEAPLLMLDLLDNRFRDDGALLLASILPGAREWRAVHSEKASQVARQVAGDAPFEMEVAKNGSAELIRIGSLYRERSSKDALPALEAYRFGLWVVDAVMTVDDLTLTVELAPQFVRERGLRLAYARDAAQKGESLGVLVRKVRSAPLGREAKDAMRELSRRGPDGWKRLLSLARELARKRSYTALPAVASLANGPEEERRALLRSLYRRRDAEDYRFAILRGLAQWYPENADLLHAGLAIRRPDRPEYFRELVRRDLHEEVLLALLKDTELADEAYSVLRDRKERVEGLGSLPHLRALEAHSPAASRAMLEEFAQRPDFKLIDGLIGLLGDGEARVARGAHLLLLTLSGRDLAPDPDLWRSWAAAKRDSYEAPHLSAPGVVAAAIQRGVAFLRRDLLEDGASVWPMNSEWPGCRVGATALVVYALRAADVPADDKALRKALDVTLLVPDASGGQPALRGDLEGYTYALCLLAMALSSVDPKAYRSHIWYLVERLVEGQLENGQWTYYCKRKDYGRRPHAGDNSNTQYAILGLRAARRANLPIPDEVWKRNAAYWRNNTNRNGGWGYGASDTTAHELSMTSAGVSSLAICLEGIHGRDAEKQLKEEKDVGLGMRRLGELLLSQGYEGEEIYAYYGIERAAILTGIRAFEEFDWYREGAAILVQTQKESGAWGKADARGVTTGEGYGEAIDTAYALLFLKRATTGLAGASGDGVVRVPKHRRTPPRAGAASDRR
ncbi:MAG: prenyltransferase/squalene oxidase repeat-containing protein [Planctomycetota bacterium]